MVSGRSSGGLKKAWPIGENWRSLGAGGEIGVHSLLCRGFSSSVISNGLEHLSQVTWHLGSPFRKSSLIIISPFVCPKMAITLPE